MALGRSAVTIRSDYGPVAERLYLLGALGRPMSMVVSKSTTRIPGRADLVVLVLSRSCSGMPRIPKQLLAQHPQCRRGCSAVSGPHVDHQVIVDTGVRDQSAEKTGRRRKPTPTDRTTACIRTVLYPPERLHLGHRVQVRDPAEHNGHRRPEQREQDAARRAQSLGVDIHDCALSVVVASGCASARNWATAAESA